MNAVLNIERRESGPSWADNSDIPDVSRTAILMAEEKTCENTELFYEWLQGHSGCDREPSNFFGPISTDELVRMGLSGKATFSQCSAIWDELRTRFLNDELEGVMDMARRFSA